MLLDAHVLADQIDTGGALGVLLLILVVLAIICCVIWLVRR